MLWITASAEASPLSKNEGPSNENIVGIASHIISKALIQVCNKFKSYAFEDKNSFFAIGSSRIVFKLCFLTYWLRNYFIDFGTWERRSNAK